MKFFTQIHKFRKILRISSIIFPKSSEASANPFDKSSLNQYTKISGRANYCDFCHKRFPLIHSKEVPLDKIPSPSKKRLVLLERLLSEYKGNLITSKKIEELSSWSAAVIRKDISLLGVHCGASNGYKVAELLQAIRKSAGLEKGKRKCCIVGLGRIGQSLLGSTELDGTDFELVAGFDSNVNRTEILHADFPLHPTTLLEKVVREEEIKFAILTVSASEAQQCAAKLSDAGIIGIVNYTPCVLSVPPSTAVENVSLLTALETLSAVSEQV